jgi:3-hydroxyacyl-CoA dehydrogenase
MHVASVYGSKILRARHISLTYQLPLSQHQSTLTWNSLSPHNPTRQADYVGLDTTLSILEGWTEQFPNEPAFVVPASLRTKVAAGRLGRKSGHGYYKWDGDKPVGPSDEPLFLK